MNDLETIDNYFAGHLSGTEKAAFEQRIEADPELAEAVAFYLQARKTVQQEAVRQQKAEWEMIRQQENQSRTVSWRPLAYAVAACTLVVLGLFLFWPKPPAEELTDRYIRENLTLLPVTMSGQPDSLQRAKQAYNEGKLTEAGKMLTVLLERDSANTELIKLSGLVSLRQGNNDKAIDLFQRLSQHTELRANPGIFYEALALLKRGQPSDKNRARLLLQTVISRNLEGRKAAERLIPPLE
ncbi:hypothetical protein GCM10027347_23430 [Larkinella harenae]